MEEFKYLIMISFGLVLIVLNMFFIPFRDKQRCRIQLGINILLLGIILYLFTRTDIKPGDISHT